MKCKICKEEKEDQLFRPYKNHRTETCWVCYRNNRLKAKLARGELINQELIGQKFGMLTVVSFLETKHRGAQHYDKYWNCTCDCGNTCIATTENLRAKQTKSCGCLKNKISKIKCWIGKRFGKLVVIKKITK